MTPKNGKSNVDDEIDHNLRRVFAQTLDEDIPDRFKSLLDQLRAKDGGAAEKEAK